MKERETFPGKTYSVHTMNGCTIIEPDGWQKTIEAPEGYFQAHFGSVVIEGDDEASIKEVFKGAPSGGGAVKILADETLVSTLASKAGNNTFTGSNVFNGALSGNGTLYGMPLQRWLGIGFCMRGVPFSVEMIKSLFPDGSTLKVLPPIDLSGHYTTNEERDQFAKLYPKIEYVFAYQNSMGDARAIGFPFSDYWSPIKEYWYLGEMTGHWFPHTEHSKALNSYYFFPKWTDAELTIVSRFGNNRIFAYIPKAKGIKFRVENYSSNILPLSVVLIGANVVQKLRFGNKMTLDLSNGRFPSCTYLDIPSTCHVERSSLLTLIDSLPAYDAGTMTAIPTASVYVNPEYQGDEEITAALLNLQTAVEDGGKGWTLAVTGITLCGAATFGLRTMYYYARRMDADGAYIDAAGQRWDVSGGTTVLRNYEANEQVPGYSAFLSLEDALAEWGLHEISPEESKADYERRHGTLTNN